MLGEITWGRICLSGGRCGCKSPFFCVIESIRFGAIWPYSTGKANPRLRKYGTREPVHAMPKDTHAPNAKKILMICYYPRDIQWKKEKSRSGNW